MSQYFIDGYKILLRHALPMRPVPTLTITLDGNRVVFRRLLRATSAMHFCGIMACWLLFNRKKIETIPISVPSIMYCGILWNI